MRENRQPAPAHCASLSTQQRAFPVAGPTVWNTLPDELRDPACDVDSFKQFFKTILFGFTSVCKFTFYLLIYLLSHALVPVLHVGIPTHPMQVKTAKVCN